MDIGVYYKLDKTNTTHLSKSWIEAFAKALQFRMRQLTDNAFSVDLVDTAQSFEIKHSSPFFIANNELLNDEKIQKYLSQHSKSCFLIIVEFLSKENIPFLQSARTFSFFQINSETELIQLYKNGKNLSLRRKFWDRINDVARDIQFSKKKSANEQKIYLSTVSEDIVEYRSIIQRELEEYGYQVLPSNNLPYELNDCMNAINTNLQNCVMSIHLFGSLFEEKLNDEEMSLSFLQNTLAAKKSEKDFMPRLIWFPPKLFIEDERQEEVIHYIRRNPNAQKGAEIFETPIEDLKFAVHEYISNLQNKTEQLQSQQSSKTDKLLYVICNDRDIDYIYSNKSTFERNGYQIEVPNFDLKGTDFRMNHIEQLKTCDASIVFYGNSTRQWLDAKINDFLKIAGYGRQRSWDWKALYTQKKLHRNYSDLISDLEIVEIN